MASWTNAVFGFQNRVNGHPVNDGVDTDDDDVDRIVHHVRIVGKPTSELHRELDMKIKIVVYKDLWIASSRYQWLETSCQTWRHLNLPSVWPDVVIKAAQFLQPLPNLATAVFLKSYVSNIPQGRQLIGILL